MNIKIRWKNPFELKERLCPICGSPVKRMTALSGWFLPDMYVCEKCGYKGPVYIEKTEDEGQ